MERDFLWDFSEAEIRTFDGWLIYDPQFHILMSRIDLPGWACDAYMHYLDHRGNIEQILLSDPNTDVDHRRVPMEEAAWEFLARTGFSVTRFYDYIQLHRAKWRAGTIDLVRLFAEKTGKIL